MTKAIGYAARSRRANLEPMKFERREPEADDVVIDIQYCGICHSDLHQARNEWKNTIYPCVPGHEIVGKVSKVGASVSRFQVGDTVGVGCMVDSCGACPNCRAGLEQYCEGPSGALMTYNGPMKPDGTNTYGGYSDHIVVNHKFVLKIPAGLDPKAAAPLLCAGVTTYSPLKHWNVGPGQEVAVIGLGGLGHMAVKLAKALGARVTVFTTTAGKEPEARRIGAADVVHVEDPKVLADHELKFDFILNTLPDPFDVNPYVKLLKRDGTLVVCGMLTSFTKPTNNGEVAFHRRQVGGTLIGGIAETQEVLEFCASRGIASDVELVPIQDINGAFDRMQQGEVRFRYVIDMATLTPRKGR